MRQRVGLLHDITMSMCSMCSAMGPPLRHSALSDNYWLQYWLSQRESRAIAKMTARCALYKYRSWALAEIWPFKLSKMAAATTTGLSSFVYCYFQICDIPRNSPKIRIYSSWRSSYRWPILVSIESALCDFLFVINGNFGRISYRFREIDI